MRFSLKLRNKDHVAVHFAKSLYPIIGIVLIWRGVWYLLDELDIWVFGKSHSLTSVVGVLLGLILLYLPKHSLREISKL